MEPDSASAGGQRAQAIARLIERVQSADFAPAFRGFDPRAVYEFLKSLETELRLVLDQGPAGAPAAAPAPDPRQFAVVLDEITARRDALEVEVGALESTRRQLQADVARLAEDKRGMERETEEVRAARLELEAQHRAAVETSKRELHEVRQAQAAAEAELRELEWRHGEVRAAAEAAEELNHARLEMEAQHHAAVESAEREMDGVRAARVELADEVRGKLAERDELAAQITRLKSEIQELEEAVDGYLEEAVRVEQHTKQRIDAMRQERARAEAELGWPSGG